MKKLKTDKEAENYLDQDLSSVLDTKKFKKIKFELKPKDTSITIRLPEELKLAFQKKAKKEGLSYQKLMREALEKYIKIAS